MSDTNSYKVMSINVKNIGTKCKLTAAMTNKYAHTHFTCMQIWANFKLATTKTVACITVYRPMS